MPTFLGISQSVGSFRKLTRPVTLLCLGSTHRKSAKGSLCMIAQAEQLKTLHMLLEVDTPPQRPRWFAHLPSLVSRTSIPRVSLFRQRDVHINKNILRNIARLGMHAYRQYLNWFQDCRHSSELPLTSATAALRLEGLALLAMSETYMMPGPPDASWGRELDFFFLGPEE